MNRRWTIKRKCKNELYIGTHPETECGWPLDATGNCHRCGCWLCGAELVEHETWSGSRYQEFRVPFGLMLECGAGCGPAKSTDGPEIYAPIDLDFWETEICEDCVSKLWLWIKENEDRIQELLSPLCSVVFVMIVLASATQKGGKSEMEELQHALRLPNFRRICENFMNFTRSKNGIRPSSIE